MRLSLQFPLHTESENKLRSLPFAVARVAKTKGVKAANGLAIAIAQRTAKQRAQVRRYLDSQLPRLKHFLGGHVPHQRANFYRVTIIRISAGTLDTDGLAGALKAVRDEVAAWLGIDDSALAPASWRYGQQRCPRGVYAVRIDIDDDDPDPRFIIRGVGAPIAKLGPIIGDVEHARREGASPLMDADDREFGLLLLREKEMELEALRSAPRPRSLVRRAAMVAKASGALPRDARIVEQAPLVFRRSYYAPAGQDEDADEVTLEELTGALFDAMDPPLRIIKGGRRLDRRQDFHPALGEHWIYEPAPSAARACDEREARR